MQIKLKLRCADAEDVVWLRADSFGLLFLTNPVLKGEMFVT